MYLLRCPFPNSVSYYQLCLSSQRMSLIVIGLWHDIRMLCWHACITHTPNGPDKRRPQPLRALKMDLQHLAKRVMCIIFYHVICHGITWYQSHNTILINRTTSVQYFNYHQFNALCFYIQVYILVLLYTLYIYILYVFHYLYLMYICT